MIALLSDNSLRFFDSAAPGTTTRASIPITGIPSGDVPVALDYTLDGNLFVVAATAAFNGTVHILVVDPESGAVTQSAGSYVPTASTAHAWDTVAKGVPNGFANGRGIYAGDDGKIWRIGLNGGDAGVTMSYPAGDAHAGTAPKIVALGSTNSNVDATSVVLYGIDSGLDTLAVVDRETGQLHTVGPLGVNTGTRAGLDISGTTGTAYASLGSSLYTINLTTGAATSVGSIIPGIQPINAPVVTDVTLFPPTRLVNISTRSRVGTSDDVMIAGFIVVGGSTPTRLVIRGIGPSLAPGVASPLADPVLSIVNGDGVEVASNDNWKSTQQSAISQTGLAPTDDAEAAYLGTFAAGAYTAIVSGKNGGTGVGVVEIYRLTNQ